MDSLYICLTIGFFLVCFGLIKLADRLMESGE